MGKTITVFGLIVVAAVCVINAAVEKPHDGLTVTINTKSLPGCSNIPTDVTAKITPASLGRGRTNFNRVEHTKRMAEMQALNCDDKGHIIASSLGGVAETWNLFPQVQRLNRGKESESHETDITRANWKGLERKAKTFLESGSAGEKREVEWKVYFDYQPMRPCRMISKLNADFSKMALKATTKVMRMSMKTMGITIVLNLCHSWTEYSKSCNLETLRLKSIILAVVMANLQVILATLGTKVFDSNKHAT